MPKNWSEIAGLGHFLSGTTVAMTEAEGNTMYSDRSFSQNAATVMMIVSGLLMIPAIFGLFFAAFVFVGSLVTMSMPGILFGATPFFFYLVPERHC